MKLLLVRLDLTPSRNRSHILSMFRAANASMLHLQDLLQEANKHSEVLRSQVADYASHLQQAAQRADEVESGLLTKFRLLLNAKKDKIRELIEAQKKLEEVIANYDTKKHIVEKEEAAPVVRASKRKAVSKVEAFPVKKELKSPSKREGRASQLSQVLHADTASYVYSGDTDALLLKEGTDATAANVASSQQSTSIQPMNVEESALPEEEVDKVPEVDKPRATSSQRIKTRFLDDSDDSD